MRLCAPACILALNNAAVANVSMMFLLELFVVDIYLVYFLCVSYFCVVLVFWLERNSFVRSTIHDATSTVAFGSIPSLL